MMRGMFAAISGLKQHQVMLDVTANDIANVNTIGYKSARVTFADSLNQMQRGASGTTTQTGGSNAAQVGLGVSLGSIDNLMTGGARQTTGNPLDVAIDGDGFFQIGRLPDDRPVADRSHLVHPRGQLLDLHHGLPDHADRSVRRRLHQPQAASPDGVAIKVPAGATGVAIDQSGGVSYVDPDTKTRVTPYRLTIATFRKARPRALGRQQWITSSNSGTPT